MVSYGEIALFVGVCLLAVWLIKRVKKNDTWRLEGILPGGHVVEISDSKKRRVYQVEDGKQTRLFVYTEDEWERGLPGREVDDG